jgi:hypothetical protein
MKGMISKYANKLRLGRMTNICYTETERDKLEDLSPAFHGHPSEIFPVLCNMFGKFSSKTHFQG